MPHRPSTVKVNARAAKRLRSGHPWVYRSDLAEPRQSTPAAALIHVNDERGRFLGSALSSSSSQIALRLFSDQQLLNDDTVISLLSERVDAAVKYRNALVHESNAFRLVFSEADRLPGLIADRYNDVITIQTLTQSMDRDDVKAAVIETLVSTFREASIVERTEPRIRELESLPPLEPHLIKGDKSATVFTMNGLSFHFDALAGQKTGAFLDQRENYAAAAQYAHGEALDVFCYRGGFALHLARVCSSVTGVDSSREALEMAERNEKLNAGKLRVNEVEWLEANAFDVLKDFASVRPMRQFDTIVLDPPAFAKSIRAVETAIRGYKEINLRAMKMLRPGGILITNSCSHHVSETVFEAMLASAAVDARRTLKILEKRMQAKDHPVIATIPETHYLKCFICYVS
jgi:23S rRNA (cytosine1962-C5)-methyltransferase